MSEQVPAVGVGCDTLASQSERALGVAVGCAGETGAGVCVGTGVDGPGVAWEACGRCRLPLVIAWELAHQALEDRHR